MKQPPNIIMQLVHIEGPLKGEIQEYALPEIAIGRHTSCNVRFPKDLAVVSRQHARIVREGNRFKIIDQSSNGTFLNGKEIKEAYIKDGDVLMFAEGGPKASFLTQTVAQTPGATAPETIQKPEPRPEPPPSPPVSPVRPEPVKQPFQEPVPGNAGVRSYAAPSPAPPEPAFSNIEAPGQIAVQQVKKPLIIQYGPTLRSYNELPVTIGQGPHCDFVLNHPAIFERHAQVFFHQEQYRIKDLSGKNPILINGRPVDREAILEPDCRLSLTSQGPDFRFLGDGRLAEIEPASDETPEPLPDDGGPHGRENLSPGKSFKEIGGIVKRMLKK